MESEAHTHAQQLHAGGRLARPPVQRLCNGTAARAQLRLVFSFRGALLNAPSFVGLKRHELVHEKCIDLLELLARLRKLELGRRDGALIGPAPLALDRDVCPERLDSAALLLALPELVAQARVEGELLRTCSTRPTSTGTSESARSWWRTSPTWAR